MVDKRRPPGIFILRKKREEGAFDLYTGYYNNNKFYWVAWIEGRNIKGGPICSRDSKAELIKYIQNHYPNLCYLVFEYSDEKV